MHKKKSRKQGITGFFEELPTAAIVIVAITIFMISTIYTITLYYRSQSYDNLLGSTYTFESAIRNSPYLLYNGTYNGTIISGNFDINKLNQLQNNDSALTNNMHPPGKFLIKITDQITNKTWNIGSALPTSTSQITIVSVITDVSIQVKNNVVDIGVMEIYVWDTSIY
jgi:hypothetical protein